MKLVLVELQGSSNQSRQLNQQILLNAIFKQKPLLRPAKLFVKILQFRATGRIVFVTTTFVYIALLPCGE